MRALVASLLAATVLVVGCDDEPEAPDGPLASTASGDVVGVESGDVESWLGIPYAAPPVDDLRWRAPEPAAGWDGVLEAQDYGPACLQGPPTALGSAPEEITDSDEDCLTLNVHRPRGAESLPVMVWVHGGAFSYGSGSQPVFNSPDLVERGVVLVTLNYRLGRLGFLAHPALEAEGQTTANFGLLDQMAALQWVRDNIDGFGGDPGNVTVFGESAGGTSVNALMSSPRAEGLFDRAIVQSGLGREPTDTFPAASQGGLAALEPLAGTTPTADELRDLDAEDVMAEPVDILDGDAPVLDDVLPAPVQEVFRAGDEAAVPYLVGTTDLEVPDVFLERLGADPGQIRDELLGDQRDAALAAYGDETELGLHLISDVIFTEPARLLAREHADAAATFRYRFSIASEAVLAELGGAPHAAELPFVFDDVERQELPVDGAAALADRMADLWVDFATDGQPGEWPSAETGEIVGFTLDGPVTGPDPWTARLDVVEAGYDRLGNSGASAS
jgi:para-nitrobenzyl esterase